MTLQNKRDSQDGPPRAADHKPTAASPSPADFRVKARDFADEALEVIVEAMRSDNPKVAVPCAQEILNRVYDKPEQAHKMEGEGLGLTVIVVEDSAAEAPEEKTGAGKP